MVIIKSIVSLMIFSAGVGCLVYKNKFAIRLQAFYISQSVKLYGTKGKWDRPWILGLFKVMIIFFGLLLITGAYPIVFGPIYFGL